MDTKFSGFIVAGRYDTAFAGVSADGYWQSLQGWIITDFDSGKKTIAIAVNDFPVHGSSACSDYELEAL